MLSQREPFAVIASHSRSKNGVATLAYGEAIQPRAGRRANKMHGDRDQRRGFLVYALRARWIASP